MTIVDGGVARRLTQRIMAARGGNHKTAALTTRGGSGGTGDQRRLT
jgi:hypothetical protein